MQRGIAKLINKSLKLRLRTHAALAVVAVLLLLSLPIRSIDGIPINGFTFLFEAGFVYAVGIGDGYPTLSDKAIGFTFLISLVLATLFTAVTNFSFLVRLIVYEKGSRSRRFFLGLAIILIEATPLLFWPAPKR